eukprot:UN00408
MKSSIMGKQVKFGSLSVQSCKDVSDSEREPLQQRRQTIAHLKEVRRRIDIVLGQEIKEMEEEMGVHDCKTWLTSLVAYIPTKESIHAHAENRS